MAIKPFEFTNADTLINQKKEQIDAMRASGDPQQQQMANSQALVDALFGDPAIQKARATDKALADGMSLTQNKGESELDFQIRQQQAIMRGAAAVDPNVSVQANNNIRSLMAERQERDKLFASDARAEDKHNREMAEAADQATPTLQKFSPLTGQWETVEIGKPGESLAFADRIEQLNSTSTDGIIYATGNLSDALNTETTPGEKKSVSGNIGKTEAKKFRADYIAQMDSLEAAEPLLQMLTENPQALQGIQMDEKGHLKPGVANRAFQFMESVGQTAMLAAEAAGLGGIVDVAGRPTDLNELVSEGLRKHGITSDIAQSRVIALAYAVAKSRDSGRLSDQDVNLALKSLVGQGGARSIAALFGDLARTTRGRMENIEIMTVGDPGIINQGIRDKGMRLFNGMTTTLEGLHKRADELNQPEAGGPTTQAIRETEQAKQTEKLVQGYQSKWGGS